MKQRIYDVALIVLFLAVAAVMVIVFWHVGQDMRASVVGHDPATTP